MNSIVERLVESWLDNQTERRYQGAFVQLLVSMGWRVLHNTRHSPIEFGKDIIARNPEGKLYCFQLKGNPGTRVTKSEAQTLLPQLIELIEVPIATHFMLNDSERHVSIFVTNGEIDEEARLLFEGVGKRTNKPNSASEELKLWSRGDLISDFTAYSSVVWPAAIEGTQMILEFFGGDGEENPDPAAISRLLLISAPPPDTKTSAPSKRSSLSSILLLSEILKSRWYKSENHYAMYLVTIVVCIYALRFVGVGSSEMQIIKDYSNVALGHCADLINEAEAKHYDADLIWAQKDLFAEIDIMNERRRLLGDCAAAYILSGNLDTTVNVEFINKLLSISFKKSKLWGFGAVPSSLLRYWAVCRVDATNESEKHLCNQLVAMLSADNATAQGIRPLASPYYTFLDCWAAANGVLFVGNDNVHTDSFTGRAWFARPILWMIAKRNYKHFCRSIWRLFSKKVHETPMLPKDRFFDAELVTEGSVESFTYRSEEWSRLLHDAIAAGEGSFLDGYEDFSWIIAAYVSIVPYRAWDKVIMWLDTQLGKTFYHKGFLPHNGTHDQSAFFQ